MPSPTAEKSLHVRNRVGYVHRAAVVPLATRAAQPAHLQHGAAAEGGQLRIVRRARPHLHILGDVLSCFKRLHQHLHSAEDHFVLGFDHAISTYLVMWLPISHASTSTCTSGYQVLLPARLYVSCLHFRYPYARDGMCDISACLEGRVSVNVSAAAWADCCSQCVAYLGRDQGVDGVGEADVALLPEVVVELPQVASLLRQVHLSHRANSDFSCKVHGHIYGCRL